MEKKEIEMTQISVDELTCMKAEMEAAKLTIRNQESEIEQKSKELDETKGTLSEMVKRLGETRDLLHSSLQLQAKHQHVAEGCLDIMKTFLYKWLTKSNQEAVTRALQFYKPEGQMKMILAVLDYLLFGKKFKSENQVEQRHFDVICTRLDMDAITLPAHSLMVKLMKKYGLFEKLDRRTTKDRVTD